MLGRMSIQNESVKEKGVCRLKVKVCKILSCKCTARPEYLKKLFHSHVIWPPISHFIVYPANLAFNASKATNSYKFYSKN